MKLFDRIIWILGCLLIITTVHETTHIIQFKLDSNIQYNEITEVCFIGINSGGAGWIKYNIDSEVKEMNVIYLEFLPTLSTLILSIYFVWRYHKHER